MIDKEYFVLEASASCPSFAWDQKSGPYEMGKPVQDPTPIRLKVKGEDDEAPEWCDYHPMDGAAISDRLKQALDALDLYGVEFVPAEITPPGPFGEVPDYWFMHIWNQISCLDADNSEIEQYQDGEIFSIEKLALKTGTLDRIELKKRQIFRLSEKTSTILVHESVKQVFDQMKATGAEFYEATEWYNDIIFD